MVMRQADFADEAMLQDLLSWTENKAIPTFNQTLSRSDIDERRRDIASYSRFKTQIEVIFLKYTLGYELVEVASECKQLVVYFEYYIENKKSPFDDSLDQYALIVWFLSLCGLFSIEIKKSTLETVPYRGKDQLIDRLIHQFDRSHLPTSQVMFSGVYDNLCGALAEYEDDARASQLGEFLDNYFKSLKAYDAFWLDSHKERNIEYFHHVGYWVFELAALVVDAGWDDSAFRDHPLYPRDLVDWKRSKTMA